jgi:protein gp37
VKESSIGWTDYSGGALNVVSGCTPVSEGCAHCYARAIYERFGLDHSKVQTHPDRLERLATMRFGRPVSLANGATEYVSLKHEGHKPMCFLCDTGDLFHEVGVSDWFLFKAFDLMAERQDVVWQVLTKRAAWMREFMKAYYRVTRRDLLPNVWLGVTAENQRTANERIPLLLDTPAAVRFVSVEPMLEAVDLRGGSSEAWPWAEAILEGHGINWVICGAESGPNRRPFDVAWALDLYEQCKAAGAPFFGKQDSGLHPGVPLVLPGYGVVQEWPA